MIDKVTFSVDDNAKLREFKESLENVVIFGDSEADEQALREKYEGRIRMKLEAGKRLTPKEMQYLRKYNPVLYAYAVRVEAKRRMVEEKLKHAKSKREVQDIKDEAIYSIGKNDPAREYMIAAVRDAVKEFKETDEYKRLPEKEEEGKRGKRQEASIIYEFADGAYQMAFVAD